MRFLVSLAFVAMLVACGGREPGAADDPPSAGEPAPSIPDAGPTGVGREPMAAGDQWDLVSSGEGAALVFPARGPARIRLFCPSDGPRLVVNVPAFRPIGSEERLSVGSGGAVEALVADPRGDARRGGVTGSGAVPANLAALVAGPVTASYGAQTSGPHPQPPPGLARGFVQSCGERKATAAARNSSLGPCFEQDGEPIPALSLRAVGTEPFWGARIEGRCVTYSHPEDQKGTRVWTRYAPAPRGGTWSGALNGRAFELRTRSAPGCSDGMSDRRYPIAVDLLVNGERRSGCAEPLGTKEG